MLLRSHPCNPKNDRVSSRWVIACAQDLDRKAGKVRLVSRPWPVLTIGLALACLAQSALAQTARMRIGLSLPLSGFAAPLAKQFLAGAQLAIDQLGAGNFEIVTADDACSSEIAALAAEDLQTAGVSLVTGLLCNEAVPPMAELFRQSGIPLVIAGARSTQLIKDGKKQDWNIWRICADDDEPASAAFKTLSQRWQNTPFAILDDGTAYGRTVADGFRARMEEAGLKPQYVDTFRPAQSTQASIARRLQRSGVSAAFITGDAEDIAMVWKNLKQLGSTIELAGGDSLGVLPWTQNAQLLPDGLLAIFEPDAGSQRSAFGLNATLASYKIEPETYLYYGFAAMQLALAALRPTPAETSTTLASTNFETVLGLVAFGQGRQNSQHRHALHVWKNGGFALLLEDDQ